MSIYGPNDEGVKALNGLGTKLPEAKDAILDAIETVMGTAESNQNVLGPHADRLQAAVEAIETEIRDVSEPIETLAEGVKDVAEGYQDVIDSNFL